MAPTLRPIVVVRAKQAKALPVQQEAPEGQKGRLNFLLAELALDAVGASEKEKATVTELKNKHLAEQARLEEERAALKRYEAKKQEPPTEEQKRKLEETRQRLREKREQRQAEREAAARREAQIQLLFSKDDKKADEAQAAAVPPLAVIEKQLPPILVEDALSLQSDLLAGLQEPRMMRKIKHLQRSMAKTDPKGYAEECQELVLKVQSELLPKYGFSGNYEGIQNMLVAFEHPAIHNNQDFVENSASLNKLLFGCTFGKTTKETDRIAIFDAEGEFAPAEREVGQAKLAEEFRRYLNKADASSNEDYGNDGVRPYKSLAARFFADTEEPNAEADLKMARKQEHSQLHLRREALNIISETLRQPAGLGAIKEEGSSQQKFDGQWEDGEGATVSIANGRMQGPNGSAMDFVIFDGTKCSLSMGSSVYEGKFSADGRLLWKDGSMWVRKMAKGDEIMPAVVAAGDEGQAPKAGGGGGGVATAVTRALGGGAGGGGGGAVGGGAGGPTGRGSSGGGAPGGDDDGEPGGEGGQDIWFEEGAPGRLYKQTLKMFHPPDDGHLSQNKTCWKDCGMPAIRSQFSTTGEHAERKSCYSVAAAAAHGAGGWALVDALREDIRTSVSQRNATRFVEAMETLEKLFPEENALRREVNSILGALPAKDKAAAKNFILQAMPFREKQIFGASLENCEVQSCLQEPSWYGGWDIPPMWMWPLPVMYAATQAGLLFQMGYNKEDMMWDDHEP